MGPEAEEQLNALWRLHTAPIPAVTLNDFSKEKAPRSGVVRGTVYLEEE